MTPDEALAQAKRTGKAVGVTGSTTSTSTLTANPNGQFTLTETATPVRKLVGGSWKSLDPALHRNADGSVSPGVTTGFDVADWNHDGNPDVLDATLY